MIKKSRWYYKSKIWRWWYRFLHSVTKPGSLLFYVIGLIVVVWLVLSRSIRSRLYQPEYLIKKVLFTTWSIAQYNDIELFDKIIQIYSWSYYSTTRIWWTTSNMVEKLLSEKPYVSSIDVSSFSQNTLIVDVSFSSPLLRFRYNDKYYGIYQDKTALLLSTWDLLGQDKPLILLPLYLSGTSESISWVLYNISAEKLLYDYLLLQTSPIQWSLTYIPWGEKYIIWNPNQRVYLNAKKDIAQQLLLLYTLKNNYNGFENLKQIDVWSLVNPIIK